MRGVMMMHSTFWWFTLSFSSMRMRLQCSPKIRSWYGQNDLIPGNWKPWQIGSVPLFTAVDLPSQSDFIQVYENCVETLMMPCSRLKNPDSKWIFINWKKIVEGFNRCRLINCVTCVIDKHYKEILSFSDDWMDLVAKRSSALVCNRIELWDRKSTGRWNLRVGGRVQPASVYACLKSIVGKAQSKKLHGKQGILNTFTGAASALLWHENIFDKWMKNLVKMLVCININHLKLFGP